MPVKKTASKPKRLSKGGSTVNAAGNYTKPTMRKNLVARVKAGSKGKKVMFGYPNMKIRKSNPKARASFRARHKCSTPGPKTKARYWSCKKC